MIELAADTRIVVDDHAVERAIERLGWVDDGTISDRIRTDVRVAILLDRVSDRRPNWTRGLGTGGQMRRYSRFAWDSDVTRCWVLDTRVAGVAAVRTVLSSIHVISEAAEQRGIRTGMERRV